MKLRSLPIEPNKKEERETVSYCQAGPFHLTVLIFILIQLVVTSNPLLAKNIHLQDTITQEVIAIPLAEINRQATQVSSLITEKHNNLLTEERKRSITSRSDTLIFRLNLLREDPRIHNMESLNFRSLTNLEGDWSLLNSRLTNEQESMTQQLQDIENEKKSIDDMLQLWQKTMLSLRNVGAPDLIIQQVASTMENLKQLRSSFLADSEFLQENLVRISTELIFCNEVLGNIHSSQEVATRKLLSPNQPPIWKEFADRKDARVITGKRSLISDIISGLKDFMLNYSFRLWLHLILFLIILIFVTYSYRNLKKYIPEKDIPEAMAIRMIVKRPVSSSFLISFLLTYILYETVPDSINLLNTLLLVIPVLFILSDIINRSAKRFIYLPVSAAVLVQIHNLGYSETAISRIFLMSIIIFGLLSLGMILKKIKQRQFGLPVRIRKIIYGLLFFCLVLLVISLFAVIAGAVMLAEFITYATIKSAVLMLIFYALSLTVNSIIIISIFSKTLQKLNLIRQFHEKLYKKLVKIVNVVTWILWLILALRLFTVWSNIYQWGKKILTSKIPIGSMDLSLGNILIFFFLIWLALKISKLIKIIVEGEIAPRVKMQRGVPGAISLLLRITIITFGFMLAIAAAGVDMTKLTILLGALGVGIGFGMQNIFNNLVSGIILAFERPIKEGDIIEVGELWGTVKEIGLRASIIFTFDGAEVIVPNGNLISNELINWTLTDQQRRVEVLVGVAYGTDPSKVLGILNKVASEHEEVLKEPTPLALFSGFGESSLDFRLLFWIPRAENRFIINSEVNTKVNDALIKAGIVIPFPQIDLHVRSADPSILGNLPSK